MIAQYNGADRKLAYLFENAREVSFSPILTTGTQIATLTIDDQTYTLYCTTGGGGGSTVSYNSLLSSGTALGELTIDGITYTIYSKDSSKVSYAATQASGEQIGTLTIDGTPYVLYAPDKVGNLNALTTTDKSNCVGAINELNNAIVVSRVTASSAIEVPTTNITQFTIPATKSGYKPIGIVGWGASSGSSNIFIVEVHIDGSGNVNGYLRNVGSSQASVSGLRFDVLYAKDV